jgi:hypothetical protein
MKGFENAVIVAAEQALEEWRTEAHKGAHMLALVVLHMLAWVGMGACRLVWVVAPVLLPVFCSALVSLGAPQVLSPPHLKCAQRKCSLPLISNAHSACVLRCSCRGHGPDGDRLCNPILLP